MTMVSRQSALVTSLFGSAILAAAMTLASATTSAPAMAQDAPGYTGEAAQMQLIRHRPEHRPGQVQGERYWQPKNAPSGQAGLGFDQPTLDFGLRAPRDPGFRYGLSAPRDRGFDRRSSGRGRHGVIHR